MKADTGASTMATAVGDPIRIGNKRSPRPLATMSRRFRAVAGFGCVHCAFMCIRIVQRPIGLGGRGIGGRSHEDPLVDCPRRGRAHGRQRPRDHEQCLQEQPSRMVRSNIRYPAPREDWAQLITGPKATPKRCGGRRCELLSKQPSALPHRTRDHSFQSPVKIDSAIAEPPNRTRTLISVLGGFVLFSERTGHVFDRPWMTGR